MKKENFKTWKSGKKWLYASTVLATLAGGAAVGTQVSADVISAANTPGVTGNTATNGASIGTPSLAGVVISDAISTNTNSAAGNTNGSYAANATGVTAMSSLGSEIPNLTTAVLTNANGAIQAGSGASSAVNFDVSQTVGFPDSLAFLDGAVGGVDWTITPPTDLASAGLTVVPISGAVYSKSLANGASISNGLNTTVYVQTAGGSYAAVNYFPDGVTIVNGSQVTDSLYAGTLSINGNQSLALVTVSYALLPDALQSYVNEFLATPLKAAQWVTGTIGDIIGGVGSFADWITGGNIPIVPDFINKYASNIQAAAGALGQAAANLDSELAHLGSAVNMLVPVTLNPDGTYSIKPDNAAFYNVLLNEVNSVINNYVTAVQNVIHAVLTIPNLDSVSSNILQNLIINPLNGIISWWDGINVSGAVSNGVINTVSGIDQWFASIASHIFSVNTPGKASLTVGFSAKDPTAQLLKEGIKDGQFAAETFKVEAKNINGDAKNNQVGFTSVVYQYKGNVTNPEKPQKPEVERPVVVHPEKPVTKPAEEEKKPADNTSLPDTGDSSSIALEALAGASLLIIGANLSLAKRKENRRNAK